ncbi:NUDIX domain-containing protein [Streptomyces griseoluteus]|uniref:NUDIX domain-containing protein n=1 Tax=Streptomyces griseoluteus TaxID=29306 RepID=UPI0036BA730F
MNPRPPARTRDTIALLAALDDGRIVVDTDGSLPTAALRPGETPSALVRGLADPLGLVSYGAAPRPAVTDIAEGDDHAAGRHVIVWHGLVPAAWEAPAPYRAVPAGQVLAALPAPEAARLRAASRAGLLGGTVRLTGGRRPGVGPSKAERTRARFTWHPDTRTRKRRLVRQVWGWLTDPDGGVLVLLDRFGTPSLPGGRPEPGESPALTLAREAGEEAAASIGPAVVLGVQEVTEHGQRPYAQLRMTAPLLGLGPAAPDPDSGETYRRVLVAARQANLLLGWGPEGDAQAAAVATAFPERHGRALRHVPETGWVPQGAGGA